MRATTVNVYKFSELSAAAKQRAKQDYESAIGYDWGEDAMASIKALAEHFGGKMKDWSIDWTNSSQSSASFRMPCGISKAEIARQLKALGSYNRKTLKGNGDCVLTGYCADEDAIDGFRAAFKAGETDLDELMQAAFSTWLKAAQADYEGQYEDDTFAETCEANGYEFYETGKMA